YTEILRKIKEPEYFGARAYCYLMTDDLQAAAEDIAQALELDPNDGELYLYRAALNKMHYRPEDAKKDAERAIQLGVDPARAQEFMTK
ncbi:tetratricopeptide repeat protein, partial [uncultured Duncaniella sp.]